MKSEFSRKICSLGLLFLTAAVVAEPALARRAEGAGDGCRGASGDIFSPCFDVVKFVEAWPVTLDAADGPGRDAVVAELERSGLAEHFLRNAPEPTFSAVTLEIQSAEGVSAGALADLLRPLRVAAHVSEVRVPVGQATRHHCFAYVDIIRASTLVALSSSPLVSVLRLVPWFANADVATLPYDYPVVDRAEVLSEEPEASFGDLSLVEKLRFFDDGKFEKLDELTQRLVKSRLYYELLRSWDGELVLTEKGAAAAQDLEAFKATLKIGPDVALVGARLHFGEASFRSLVFALVHGYASAIEGQVSPTWAAANAIAVPRGW